MIRQVILRRFKRFEEVTFDLPGHVVLAGPNNTGKTTVLQAVAAWSLGLEKWRQLNDWQKHNGVYAKAPMARQAFSAVPLRSFDLLWNERKYKSKEPIEIEIHSVTGWGVTLEFIADSTEQIYVRPARAADRDVLRERKLLEAVYVPPMTGLSTDEPVYQAPKVKQLLGQGKPGDVIRNLLVEAHQLPAAWTALHDSILRLFGYILLPPNSGGADIIAEYQTAPDKPKLDIASAGSGFQQVLMLLTFLHTRPASVLLLDEPDAHLHVILQDAIYGELRSVAGKQNSQLIVATHSEIIIDSVEPRELCILLDQPRQVENEAERRRLSAAMGILQNTDIMLARIADGILYVEGHTDIAILREWSRVLNHPAYNTLTTKLFWKPTVEENRLKGKGIEARNHYEALQLVRDDLPGLIILDGDTRVPATPVTGQGLQRICWQRAEIENYLVHPAALARYVTHQVGEDAAPAHLADLQTFFTDTFPPAALRDPLGDNPFLLTTKARKQILPQAFTAAGIHGIEYTRYHEIAAIMLPEEIHPEVIEKLDAIQGAFGL